MSASGREPGGIVREALEDQRKGQWRDKMDRGDFLVCSLLTLSLVALPS